MDANQFDVVIIGAGLSGIGLACHLKRNCPEQRYAILESRESMGGTWDLFRYPGIRSDSDMTTMSYNFKPWDGVQDIASGSSILRYLQDAAADYDIERHIRYNSVVNTASWSSSDAMWTVEATNNATGQRTTYQCNLLLMCAGYYSYASGFTPDFEGLENFRGTLVHPQKWPDDLSYRDQDVVVIGSGATAVTLVPAMARQAKHVVMLQRSPTYMLVRPEVSRVGKWLRRLLPNRLAYSLYRQWNIKAAGWLYRRTRTHPGRVKTFLVNQVRKYLGPDFDVDTHFTPPYDPWDQRLCVVPDGDLFSAIKSGSVSVVTDQVEHFTEDGIQLRSGKRLHADIVVTATGLNMKPNGGVQISVDGAEVDFSKTYTYKGMMNSDVPNLITTFGYINASWTLRSDLIANFVCRTIKYMKKHQYRRCTPRLRLEDHSMGARQFIEDFSPNYIQRAAHLLPKQGDREPWLNSQDYQQEVKSIGQAPLSDGVLTFDDPRSTN